MGTTHLKRVSFIKMPSTPTASLAIFGDWGDAPVAALVAGSNDQRGRVSITPDVGSSGSPGWVLTFNEPWETAPFAIVVRNGASTQPSVSTSTTALSITQTGALVVGAPIFYDYMVLA